MNVVLASILIIIDYLIMAAMLLATLVWAVMVVGCWLNDFYLGNKNRR